ncbi:uncharacterized protein LOC129779202 isoform X2 [Toxorhynchites rutilus septentrionalis]|uniref:uncharacterized protein LOC129779202 isoform X2 n=1 Tax=Toxorhynchites rutilus septentrionalis TaxID=329112 RepID=UPI0024787696|nr:uncharacterized protein LOC129779202 isoform X2 [Toxorhynchites rutilus septentrionalis]
MNPPYRPEPAPSDYHLFLALQNFQIEACSFRQTVIEKGVETLIRNLSMDCRDSVGAQCTTPETSIITSTKFHDPNRINIARSRTVLPKR